MKKALVGVSQIVAILCLFGVMFLPTLVTGTSPGLVQAKASTDKNANSNTLTFASNVTAGNAIIVYIGWWSGSVNLTNISDSLGNTYTILGNPTPFNNSSRSALAYALNVKGGANTITVTFSSKVSSIFEAHEVQGIAQSNALDQYAISKKVFDNTFTSPSITTTSDGDYVFTGMFNVSGNGGTLTSVSSPFSLRLNPSQISSADMIQASRGPITASGSIGSNVNMLNAIVSFKTTPAAPDITPPSVPLNLSASPLSSSQINLSWSASTDPTVPGQSTSGIAGYKVIRNGNQIATSTGISFNDVGLSASTTYYYSVSAFDLVGNNSIPTALVSTTTYPVLAPNITSFISDPSSITLGQSTTLSWSVLNATTLNIDNGVGNVSGTTRVVAPTTTTTYTLSATNNSLSTTSKTTVIVSPDVESPTAPQNLSANPVSSSQINLSWTISSDNIQVTGYKLYRNESQIATTTVPFYNDTGLVASTTYSYTVSAYDPSGNVSIMSEPVLSTTPAPLKNILRVVQSKACSSGASTGDFACTGLTPTTAGNLLVVFQHDGDTTSAPSVPTSSDGTWQQACTFSGLGARFSVFYLPSATGGNTSYTVRPASGHTASTFYEVSGAAASPLDVCSSAENQYTYGATSGEFLVPPPITSSQNGIVFGWARNELSSSRTFVAGSGWTGLDAPQASDANDFMSEYLTILNGIRGQYTPGIRASSGSYAVGAIAFKGSDLGNVPTGISPTYYTDFETGSEGTAITPPIMHSATHGTCQEWIGSTPQMTISTSAQQNLHSNVTVGGNTYTDAGSSKGVKYDNGINSNSYIMCKLSRSASNFTLAGFVTIHGTAPYADRLSFMTINGVGGGDYVSAQWYNGSIVLETKTADSPAIPVLLDHPYYYVLNYSANGTHSMKIYDASTWLQVGQTMTNPAATGNVMAFGYNFGNSHNDIAHTPGSYIYFDNIIGDITGGSQNP